MTQPMTWKRILWPFAVVAVAMSVTGVECQYEPVPDRRRGFTGDPCIDGAKCQAGLVCVREEKTSLCRPQCDPADPQACGGCGASTLCTVFPSGDGGATAACAPAAVEG